MVYFVGAGCGAADLITVRGDALLRKADVVIWAGSLVNPALLESCKPECELHNSATMTLEDVLAVMQKAHAQGSLIVRLHTGDSSIYGAIREQMDALAEMDIPFEVVPGVSSFCGAAAALKAELTLPGVSQSVILTRMEGRTPMPQGESMRELASHGATMVIFLSASLLGNLQKELLAGGYSEQTPVAIVYKATWPDQQIYHCTVGTLEAVGKENGISLTSLIVVGDVLGSEYERSLLYDPNFTTLFRTAHSTAN